MAAGTARSRRRLFLDLPAEHIEKRLAGLCQALLEPLRTVTGAASPRLSPIFIAAPAAIMGVLDAAEVEIFFPVRSLFKQRARTITDLNPASRLILTQPCIFHVAKVLAPGNRASPQGMPVDCFQEIGLTTGLNLSAH